jgi:hypothetical protein
MTTVTIVLVGEVDEEARAIAMELEVGKRSKGTIGLGGESGADFRRIVTKFLPPYF